MSPRTQFDLPKTLSRDDVCCGHVRRGYLQNRDTVVFIATLPKQHIPAVPIRLIGLPAPDETALSRGRPHILIPVFGDQEVNAFNPGQRPNPRPRKCRDLAGPRLERSKSGKRWLIRLKPDFQDFFWVSIRPLRPCPRPDAPSYKQALRVFVRLLNPVQIESLYAVTPLHFVDLNSVLDLGQPVAVPDPPIKNSRRAQKQCSRFTIRRQRTRHEVANQVGSFAWGIRRTLKTRETTEGNFLAATPDRKRSRIVAEQPDTLRVKIQLSEKIVKLEHVVHTAAKTFETEGQTAHLGAISELPVTIRLPGPNFPEFQQT